MQKRHSDPARYFDEMAASCREYYLPYITTHTEVGADVLEVGCGLGGTLSVFAQRGHRVAGVDISTSAVESARKFFAERGLEGTFTAANIFDHTDTRKYDLVILHDAIEHIPDKERLMRLLKGLLKPEGVLYIAFPAWQMPFGGHQQMARNRVLAVVPYTHLLPRAVFRALFRACGESEGAVRDYLSIRDTRLTIESFERLVRKTELRILDRRLYLINPNYKVKFGLRPRILAPFMARIPRLRNFFATTCYYLLN